MASPINILLVDDNPADRRLVMRTLEKGFGDVVIDEADSREALTELLEGRVYDVIVTDYALRGLTGLEVISMVREAGLDTPIIMLTGTGTEEVAIEAMKRGVSDYVIKSVEHIKRLPFTVEHVLERVDLARGRKRAEEATRTSSQRVEHLVSSSPTVIYSCKVAGNWAATFITKNVEKAWGYKASDFLEPDFWIEHLHPDDKDRIFSGLGRLLKSGSHHHEYRFMLADGTYHWISDQLRLVCDDHGKPLECVGSCTDITERKRAEEALRESEERHRHLFSNLVDAAFLADAETGRIIEANREAEKLLGRSRNEIVGMDQSALHPPEEAERYRRVFSEHVAGGRAAGTEAEVVRKDGAMVPVRISASTMTIGGRRCILGVFRDVTRQKQAEEERRQLGEHLRGLASQLSSAEDRERRRVAVGLHDHVGQNLGAMNMHLQILRDAELSETQAGALGESLALLKEVSAAVRTMTFELCPPMLYETGLVAALSWLVGQHGQGLPAECWFKDDGQAKPLNDEALGFVFGAVRELLINVARYADARHVRVSTVREGDLLKACVEDDGIGFDPTSIGPAGGEGAGFGLFSIRERVKHLGGRFEIESAPGRGSRFTLVVPMGSAKGEESSPAGSAREPRG